MSSFFSSASTGGLYINQTNVRAGIIHQKFIPTQCALTKKEAPFVWTPQCPMFIYFVLFVFPATIYQNYVH